MHFLWAFVDELSLEFLSVLRYRLKVCSCTSFHVKTTSITLSVWIFVSLLIQCPIGSTAFRCVHTAHSWVNETRTFFKKMQVVRTVTCPSLSVTLGQKYLQLRHPIILGISPGNPYYSKQENLKRLIRFAVSNSDQVTHRIYICFSSFSIK